MKSLSGVFRASLFVGALVASATAWASSVNVTLLPDPPKMGKQTVEIKVLDDKGKPSKEANVAVEAAMPATSSMPAMKSKGKVEKKGEGAFTARFNLSMDGLWILKITVGKGATAETFDYQLTTGKKGVVRTESPSVSPAFSPTNNPGSMEHHNH